MKIKRFAISPDVLVLMGSGIFRVVRGSIPEDVRVHQTTIDPLTGAINIFLLSETFQDLPDQAYVPLMASPEIHQMNVVELSQFLMDRVDDVLGLAYAAPEMSNEVLRDELRKWSSVAIENKHPGAEVEQQPGGSGADGRQIIKAIVEDTVKARLKKKR